MSAKKSGQWLPTFFSISLFIIAGIVWWLALDIESVRWQVLAIFVASIVFSLSAIVLVAQFALLFPGAGAWVLKLLAWVSPTFLRYREISEQNARVRSDFAGVLRAFRLVDSFDSSQELTQSAVAKSPLDDLKPQDTKKFANEVAKRVVEQRLVEQPNEPDGERVTAAASDTGGSDLTPILVDQERLGLCLNFLYNDLYEPKKCDWNETNGILPLLARLIMRHEVLLAAAEQYDVRKVEDALSRIRTLNPTKVTQELRKEPKAIVDSMINVLDHYGIKYEPLTKDQRRKIAGDLSGIAYVECARVCAEGFAREFGIASKAERDRKARLLELLYRQRFNRPTIRLWSSHKPEIIKDLEGILSKRGPLAASLNPHNDETCAKETQNAVKVILESMADFDLSFASKVGVRVRELWEFESTYAEYLSSNGIACATTYEQFLNRIRGMLPANQCDWFKLGSRTVNLDLLMEIGESSVKKLIPKRKDGEVRSLSLALAGSYLTRAGRWPGLSMDLARHAGLQKDKETVSTILLALMYRHRATGGVGSVPLGELAIDWQDWRDEAKRKYEDLYDVLTASIRAELRSGIWPTRLPIDEKLAGLADQGKRIIGALNALHDAGRLTKEKLEDLQQHGLPFAGTQVDVEKALKTRFSQLQGEMQSAVRYRQFDEKIGLLADEIQKIRDPGLTKLECSFDELKTAVQQVEFTTLLSRLVKQVKALAAVDKNLTKRVTGLEGIDLRLVDNVATLAAAEADLAKEMREICLPPTDDFPVEIRKAGDRSQHYLITFDADSGHLAPLVDSLNGNPDFSFVQDTPSSRIGRLPVGMPFETFYDSFFSELDKALASAGGSVCGAEVKLHLIAHRRVFKVAA